MIIPHLPTGFKLAAHRSRCISGLLTNTGLLTLAVMTKVLEKQAANRERRLCAADLLTAAARTTVGVEQAAKAGAQALRELAPAARRP